eukprot:367482-Pleurochrysis_carterae.AAC.3
MLGSSARGSVAFDASTRPAEGARAEPIHKQLGRACKSERDKPVKVDRIGPAKLERISSAGMMSSRRGKVASSRPWKRERIGLQRDAFVHAELHVQVSAHPRLTPPCNKARGFNYAAPRLLHAQSPSCRRNKLRRVATKG